MPPGGLLNRDHSVGGGGLRPRYLAMAHGERSGFGTKAMLVVLEAWGRAWPHRYSRILYVNLVDHEGLRGVQRASLDFTPPSLVTQVQLHSHALIWFGPLDPSRVPASRDEVNQPARLSSLAVGRVQKCFICIPICSTRLSCAGVCMLS